MDGASMSKAMGEMIRGIIILIILGLIAALAIGMAIGYLVF